MGLNPIGNSNWARETTDLVEKYVGMVRDKATNRVETAVKWVAFGAVAVMFALIAAVLGLVIVTRSVQRLLKIGLDDARAVWVSYVGLGIIFTAAGLWLVAKARTPSKSA